MTAMAFRFRTRVAGIAALLWSLTCSSSVLGYTDDDKPITDDTAYTLPKGKWRIGLFAIVAPQGLGVFEPTLVALVGWSADALLLVGAFRVVLVIRDLALTGLAAVASRRRAG